MTDTYYYFLAMFGPEWFYDKKPRAYLRRTMYPPQTITVCSYDNARIWVNQPKNTTDRHPTVTPLRIDADTYLKLVGLRSTSRRDPSNPSGPPVAHTRAERIYKRAETMLTENPDLVLSPIADRTVRYYVALHPTRPQELHLIQSRRYEYDRLAATNTNSWGWASDRFMFLSSDNMGLYWQDKPTSPAFEVDKPTFAKLKKLMVVDGRELDPQPFLALLATINAYDPTIVKKLTSSRED